MELNCSPSNNQVSSLQMYGTNSCKIEFIIKLFFPFGKLAIIDYNYPNRIETISLNEKRWIKLVSTDIAVNQTARWQLLIFLQWWDYCELQQGEWKKLNISALQTD